MKRIAARIIAFVLLAFTAFPANAIVPELFTIQDIRGLIGEDRMKLITSEIVRSCSNDFYPLGFDEQEMLKRYFDTHQEDGNSIRLELGDSGNDVLILQVRLEDLSFYSSSPSGIFDSETETAVVDLQKICQFAQTGKVSKALYDALESKVIPNKYVLMNSVIDHSNTVNKFVQSLSDIFMTYFDACTSASELSDIDTVAVDTLVDSGLTQSLSKTAYDYFGISAFPKYADRSIIDKCSEVDAVIVSALCLAEHEIASSVYDYAAELYDSAIRAKQVINDAKESSSDTLPSVSDGADVCPTMVPKQSGTEQAIQRLIDLGWLSEGSSSNDITDAVFMFQQAAIDSGLFPDINVNGTLDAATIACLDSPNAPTRY